jgi:hypothetical protein
VLDSYRFLQVVAEQLLTHYGLPWPVVWRYICYVSSRHWQANGEAITVVDRQLIEAARHTDYRPHMRACFLPDMALLDEAKKMAGVSRDSGEAETLRELKQLRQELRQFQQQGGSGRPQGKPDKKAKGLDREWPKKCGLCGSTEHIYCAGAYDHPADMPITNRCPKKENGKQCKLYHAYKLGTCRLLASSDGAGAPSLSASPATGRPTRWGPGTRVLPKSWQRRRACERGRCLPACRGSTDLPRDRRPKTIYLVLRAARWTTARSVAA